MPTQRKLVASAAHTRQQADFFEAQVGNAEEKVRRAEAELDAAEAALQRAIEKAQEKRAEADEAAQAAEGLPSFAQAQTAAMGVGMGN